MPAVAFSLFAGAGWQFLDDNGDPLSGGLVYTYEAGTTTPAATYTSSAGTTANPNPVELDAAGRPPEEIWVLSGDSYKFAVHDADDDLIRTYDNIPATDAGVTALIADLISTASGKGAGMIGFSQSATYADSTVGEKLQQVVSVKDHPFNAVGDNVADDTAAFQAALATGSPVFVPEGTYLITGALDIASSGQTVFGAGQSATTIRPVGNFDLFTADGGVEHVGISRMSVSAIGMSGGYIWNGEWADRVICEQLRIDNPFNSFRVHRCNKATFDEIYGQRPRGSYAFHLDGSGGHATNDRSDVIIITNSNYGGLDSAKTWTGIYLEGNVNTVQSDHTTFVNALRGFHCVEADSQVGQFFIFYDFEVDFPANETIRAEAGAGLWYTTPYAQGSDATGGIYIGADFSSVMITNSYIRGNNEEGIVIAGQDVNIANCQVVFNSYPDLMDFDAIQIEATANRVMITNCLLGGLEGVGTVVRAPATVEDGATDIRFSNCSFYGCLYPEVRDLTTPIGPYQSVVVVGCGNATYPVNTKIPGFEIGTANGSGASGTPTLLAGVVSSIAIDTGGDYDTAPLVAMLPGVSGLGSGFVGTAVLTNRAVTSVTIGNGGANYTSDAKLAFWPVDAIPKIKSVWYGQPDIPIRIAADGIGYVQLENDAGVAARATAEASAVNYPELISKATGSPAQLLAVGSDTNVDLALTPQGATGALQLGGAVSAAGAVGALDGHLIVRIGGALKKIPYFAIS